ncbi:TatD family hydrolase [Patescibacteria group bacterium]|nr:TatD family hydrolase [Patescibacteria group bacterium]MBU4057233.1 TatD family hydrolase [Patescibacteria group bacterium]MBU4368343.1 TatD family hydrolase [Patescibacteria group bacterium]
MIKKASIIDTHAHLDFKEFDRDREETIKRFFKSGGKKIINVGCDLKSSARSVALAEKYENIFASVGVHPHDADTFDAGALKKLEELTASQKAVAIGEIGLDYFRPESSGSPKEKQIEAFKLQLDLAENHKKPVIIHCRDAYVELIEILKNYQPKADEPRAHKTPILQGVVHCFLGSWPIAEKVLKLGFYIGFTGAITYAKEAKTVDVTIASKIKLDELDEPLDFARGEPEIFKVIKNMPIDRILIETDCPYLAPALHRGERNEPSYIKYVAEKIAEIKGISVGEVEKATSENARKLFGI